MTTAELQGPDDEPCCYTTGWYEHQETCPNYGKTEAVVVTDPPTTAATLTICGGCDEGECCHIDCPSWCQCDRPCDGCGAVRPQECVDE